MRNQTLHIFKKDIRYLWREILLLLAVLTAYGWNAATRPEGLNPFGVGFSVFSAWLPGLVLISWVLLIVRAVYAESLVGDRQFWVTRPYEWKKLLAAKMFFVLVFINFPLLILQAFLLGMVGFSPTSHVVGLLWLQLLWVVILILPVATLGAVTASIGQFILSVLGVLIYLMAVGWGLSALVPAQGVDVGNWILFTLQLLLPLGAGVAVVLGQFARRRTAKSRILLLGAALLYPVIALVTPHRMLIERAYPQRTAGQPLPVLLAFDLAKLASREGGYPEKGKAHVRVPLLVSGIAEGSAVFVRGKTVNIQSAGGAQWNSGWHGSWEALIPNRPHGQEDITLDRDFFERVKSSPVKVRITYAFAPMRARETVRIVAQPGPFAVPGEGRCSFSPFDPGQILCVFPINPPLMLASVRSHEISCPARPNETPLPAGTIGYGWVWGFEGSGFGINPVHSQPLYLSDWGDFQGRDSRPRLCPGTPLTLAIHWEELPRLRSEVEIDGIRLADYQLDDRMGGTGGFTLSVP